MVAVNELLRQYVARAATQRHETEVVLEAAQPQVGP